MRRRTLILLQIGGLALIGCAAPTTSPPGDGNTSEQLSASQQRAIEAVLDAVEGLGRASAGALPAAKAPAIFNGDLAEFACMDLASQAAVNIVELQIEFGGNCDPSLFIGDSASGTISGAVSTDTGAVTLSMSSFAVEDQTTDGTWEGTVERSDGVSSFSVDVDLVLSVGEGIVDGHVDIEVDEDTGVTRIIGGTVTAVGTDFDPIVIDFDNTEIDFVSNGGFNPQAGGASFIVPGDGGSDPVHIALQFSPQTATSNTVMVQVDDGAEFDFTEPDA